MKLFGVLQKQLLPFSCQSAELELHLIQLTFTFKALYAHTKHFVSVLDFIFKVRFNSFQLTPQVKHTCSTANPRLIMQQKLLLKLVLTKGNRQEANDLKYSPLHCFVSL